MVARLSMMFLVAPDLAGIAGTQSNNLILAVRRPAIMGGPHKRVYLYSRSVRLDYGRPSRWSV